VSNITKSFRPPSLRLRLRPRLAQRRVVPESKIAGQALSAPPFSVTSCFSQHEVFENEFAFACGQRSATSTAGDRARDRLWSGLHFDDLIERVAVRAKVQWLVGRHKTPLQTDWCTSRMILARLFGDLEAPGVLLAGLPPSALADLLRIVGQRKHSAVVAALRKPRLSGWWHATIARRGPRAVHPLFCFPPSRFRENKGAGLVAA
jgi:hypothetical protein